MNHVSLRSRLRRFGGPGLFTRPLSTSNLYTPSKETVLRYLAGSEADEAGRSPALFTELGRRLCSYHQARYCVLFSTGFWALVATVQLRASPGKNEVIIPSLTYRRLADVVYWAGLIPVFVDVDDDLAVSPAAVAENIGPATALILAVHPIVNCCDVHALLDISRESGVPMVIDAVESVHETVRGQRVGSFGVGEVFSFHASKLINGIEGGYVCTDDGGFAQALTDYRDGIHRIEYAGSIYRGLNGLPHAGHAAFALAGLDELQANIDHNQAIYRTYQRCLSGISGLRLVAFDEREQTSYKNIVVEVEPDFPVTRDVLCAAMTVESILARKHYCPPLHRKRFAYPTLTRSVTRTERAETRFLNLPCGSRVAPVDVSGVCDFIRFVAANSGLFSETVP